ncbi:MAG: hypothetical protein KatS3mg106_645 [Gemmataceae bacterium]|nr:MAG: hypothetical protein KatS3mg106_645 [Gemmataceae bacterium]
MQLLISSVMCGNDLDGLALVVAAPLLFDDGQIDFPRGVVAIFVQGGVGESFIMAQVEVGFGSVVQDVNFPMLVGGHGAGIDVDVGVHLLHAHAQSPALEEHADGRRSQTFAQGADHAPRYENVFGHSPAFPLMKRVGTRREKCASSPQTPVYARRRK